MLRQHTGYARGIALMLIAALGPGSQVSGADAPAHDTRWGARTLVGSGIARTWVTVAHDGSPLELGVALSEAVITGRARDARATLVSTAVGAPVDRVSLPLPAGAPAALRDVVLDWSRRPTPHETRSGRSRFTLHFTFADGAVLSVRVPCTRDDRVIPLEEPLDGVDGTRLTAWQVRWDAAAMQYRIALGVFADAQDHSRHEAPPPSDGQRAGARGE